MINTFYGIEKLAASKKEPSYPACVGSKIRSGGKGRGFGTGMGKGPIGVPIGKKLKLIKK